MFYLYILRNNKGKHYIGISANIEKRLESHNLGKVRSTKPFRPWSLVYTESYKNRSEARQREVQLKTNYTERKKVFNMAPSSSPV